MGVRGRDNRTGELFSYVDLEARVRRDHPLRAIRTIVNEALSALEREFAGSIRRLGGRRSRRRSCCGRCCCRRLLDPLGAASDGAAGIQPKGKGKETKLCFIGHGLMENRNGRWSTPA